MSARVKTPLAPEAGLIAADPTTRKVGDSERLSTIMAGNYIVALRIEPLVLQLPEYFSGPLGAAGLRSVEVSHKGQR